MTKVFLNYRVGDSHEAAARLRGALGRQPGASSIFFASGDVAPGTDFRRMIDAAVTECDVMLVLIGPRWLDIADERGRRLDQPDDLVRHEIASALRLGKRVIPVLLDDAQKPRRDRLPPDLAALPDRQWTTVRYQYFDHDLTLLRRALRPRHRRPGWVWIAAGCVLVTAAVLVAVLIVPDSAGSAPAVIREGSVTLRPSYLPCDKLQDKIDLDSGLQGHGGQAQTPCAPPGGLAELIVEDTEIHTADDNRIVLLPADSNARAAYTTCADALADPKRLRPQLPLDKLGRNVELCVRTTEGNIAAITVTGRTTVPTITLAYIVWKPA